MGELKEKSVQEGNISSRAEAFNTQDSDQMPHEGAVTKSGSSQIWIKSDEHGGLTSRSCYGF